MSQRQAGRTATEAINVHTPPDHRRVFRYLHPLTHGAKLVAQIAPRRVLEALTQGLTRERAETLAG